MVIYATYFHVSAALTSIPTYSANSVSTFFRSSISRVSAIPTFSAAYLNQLGPKVNTFYPPAIGGRIPTFSAKFRPVENPTPEVNDTLDHDDVVDDDLELYLQSTQQRVLADGDGDVSPPPPYLTIVNNCGSSLSAVDVGNGQSKIISAGDIASVPFNSLDDTMQLPWALDRDNKRYGYAQVSLTDKADTPSFSLSFLEGNPFQFWGQALEADDCEAITCAPADGQCPRTIHHLDKTSGANVHTACPSLQESSDFTFTACTGLVQEGALPNGMPSHPSFSYISA